MLNPLDDQLFIRNTDTEGMLAAIEGFPAQCAEAVALAEKADLKGLDDGQLAGEINSIVTLGMGGSGIGGDLLKTLAEPSMGIPVIVNKGYSLPAFVGPNTLVLAVSYSGETEETLATFEAAVASGAKIVVISAGGTITKRAGVLGLPVVAVPAGLQPRAALGYLALPLLIVLRRLGLFEIAEEDISAAISLVENIGRELGQSVAAIDNPAKQLAIELAGSIPIIYGSEGLSSVAALRWKCQLNENAKIPAFWHSFPELDHNEIVGWQELPDLSARLKVVILRDGCENDRVKARIEITSELIGDNVGGISEVAARGSSDISRLLSLIYIGDFVSFYLAILNGVDPAPVKRIKLLKQRLSEIH